MPRSARLHRSLFAAFSVTLLPLTALASSARAAAAPAVTDLAVSQQRIAEDDGETTVSFRAARPGTVVFTLTEVGPIPRKVGRFGVPARAGANDFRFPGRIDRRLLRPGSYRLTARGPGGRAIGVVLVVEPRAAPASEARPAEPDETSMRPFVVAALLVAIALLGVASLPASVARSPRVAEVLGIRRTAVAAAGGVALSVAFVLYFLSVG